MVFHCLCRLLQFEFDVVNLPIEEFRRRRSARSSIHAPTSQVEYHEELIEKLRLVKDPCTLAFRERQSNLSQRINSASCTLIVLVITLDPPKITICTGFRRISSA